MLIDLFILIPNYLGENILRKKNILVKKRKNGLRKRLNTILSTCPLKYFELRLVKLK